MSAPKVDRTWSIDLFGRFNPAITTVAWFGRQGALPAEDVASALVADDTIGASISAGVLSIEVTLDRFLVQTTDASAAGRLPGFVDKVFGVLSHTPVDSIALGVDCECSGYDAESQHAVLGRFAPDAQLASVGSTLARSVTLRVGGLSEETATCHLTVEDSDAAVHGVYVSVVDEIDAPDDGDVREATAAIRNLDKQWQRFLARSTDVVDEILQLQP